MTSFHIEQADRPGDPLHVSVRASSDGRWDVCCEGLAGPLINVTSREAAVKVAMSLAVNHSPTTVEVAG